MRRGGRLAVWLVAATLALGQPDGLRACAFHGYTPDPTLVDFLLNTEQAVLARLAPDNPEIYRPHRALLGPALTSLPMAATPETKAQLEADPGLSVLLARDGAYGPWQEMAVVDASFQAVIDHVLERQSAWLLGAAADRLPYFATKLNDPNGDLRRLALRELDRARYADLKALPLPHVAGLADDLANGDPELRPIRLLLAGLSAEPEFSPMLRDGLQAALAAQTPHLGAYAVAMIELDGPAAVRALVEGPLSAPTTSQINQTRLLEAMAIQYRAAAPELRRQIAGEMAGLMRASPHMRAAITAAFDFTDTRQIGP